MLNISCEYVDDTPSTNGQLCACMTTFIIPGNMESISYV